MLVSGNVSVAPTPGMAMIKTITRTLAVFAVSFATLSVASDKLTHRIVGGEDAATGAWPSIVALLYSPEQGREDTLNRQFCAGNVIADRWILTAAHCLFDPRTGAALSTDDYTVAYNVDDLLSSNQPSEIAVKAFEVHPFYDLRNQASYHDIALLELAEPTPQPSMDLFQGDIEALNGSAAAVIGWGATQYTPTTRPVFPTRLNQAVVPLVSREVCNQPQSYQGILQEGQICAGYQAGGIDSCVGDSGGPLMVLQNGNYQQVGIVSFGDGCAQADKYGVYADVDFYASWIKQYLDGTQKATNSVGKTQPSSGGKELVKSQGGAVHWSWMTLLVFGLIRRRGLYCSFRNSSCT